MNVRSTFQDALKIARTRLVGSLAPVKLDMSLEKIHYLVLVR